MSLMVRQDIWQNWPREAMKSDITRWLEHGLELDGYLVVSLSKKKHILLQAPMNAQGSRELAIQVEEQVAHIRLEDWLFIDQIFMNLLVLGHNKGEILSGELYGATLRKHGCWQEALMYSQELELWRKSPQIELLSYVTIYEKGKEDSDGLEDKSRGNTDQLRAGIGDQTDSVNPAQSRVERNRQRVPQQVSNGDLENVRGKSGSSSENYTQLDLFSL